MKYPLYIHVLIAVILLMPCCKTTDIASTKAGKGMKALIIDGENNHGVWPMTTIIMKDYLEQTGLFAVDIIRTKYTWQGPHHNPVAGVEHITELLEKYPIPNGPITEIVEKPKYDPNFKPDFEKYDLVISNMGWQASSWSPELKLKFESYMKNGGGLVIVHAANNSWGDWPEFNKMIGLGGWGGRGVKDGPYVFYDKDGNLVRDPGEGGCGSHGMQQEFVVTTRAADHPIMNGLPLKWMHTQDEIYDRLRGPAENMTILATAFSDKDSNGPPWDKSVSGTDRHEPMLMAIDYGKGRVFHTGLGHMDYSMECVGFITTFQRGSEWAASGLVTQAIPTDFPGIHTISTRSWTGRN